MGKAKQIQFFKIESNASLSVIDHDFNIINSIFWADALIQYKDSNSAIFILPRNMLKNKIFEADFKRTAVEKDLQLFVTDCKRTLLIGQGFEQKSFYKSKTDPLNVIKKIMKKFQKSFLY